MTSSTSKEIADEYISSLSELTFNSKPLINMLTMLAEDNVEHAAAIVKAVENHLQKVRSDIKLPVLYLIDSIVKNVNGAYLKLFTENIVNTFCCVFEKVDEKTRESMWKLRQTWNDVFPAKKLFSLDVRVQSIDPAWPIAPLSPAMLSGSIHLNPRFLSMSQQNATTPTVNPVKTPEPVSVSEAAMREQLLKKQKELLELQKQKIELELLQAKTSLEQQQKQLDKQTAAVKAEMTIPTAHVIPTTEVAQGKPVAPVAPSQPSKTPVKLPVTTTVAATSRLKTPSGSNGPRIAPASSLLVASARSLSRDPRIKSSSSSQDQPSTLDTDSQSRPVTLPNDNNLSMSSTTPAISTVLVDQLKQQLITKQAVTSNMIKTTLDVSSLNASNNDNNPISSLNNNNNKSLTGNMSRDAVLHRTSQKKDPRSSNSNNNSNINSNNSKLNQNLSSSLTGTSNNSRRGDFKSSKDTKSSSMRSSNSNIEKSSSSSSLKSSHRKLGSKSRSKQPQISPNKIAKVDRESSPIRSKSREKDSCSDGSSSTSSRTSPQSSSPLSKNRKKNSSKSRKRSPSPPYRIPRRNVETKSNSSLSIMSVSGLTEEEQESGSLIVSPPHPPAFKEIRPNARQRNYIRRNKDAAIVSPENSSQSAGVTIGVDDIMIESASKDEDLRATLPPPSSAIVSTVVEKKEDLDLRVLPPANKRQSSEHIDISNPKKNKTEKFDALFGNEDVDLRTLTHPKVRRPPTPPPPVISGEDSNVGWAKIKTPQKSEREKSSSGDEKRERDRNKERTNRPRPYNKLCDDMKDRRRPFGDEDSRLNRRNRDLDKPDRITSDRNYEIIMKQAQEQLNQGSISKADYHKVIQEIWQMNEDQKLRAAQRKEKEVGSIVWEKGMDIGGFNPTDGDKGHRGKDHPHGRNGPRWQGPWQQHPGAGPWTHPPGFSGHFNTEFRPMGPWQNSRQFGPIRPDFNQFHGFNPNMGPGPRMGPGLLGPMGPNGPMMPGMMPNGPIGPMGIPNPALANMNGPPPLMINGPPQAHSLMGRIPSPARNISPNSAPKFDVEDSQSYVNKESLEQSAQNRELPLPDIKLIEEVNKDTMKSINIDGIPREIRYYGQTGVVFMNWDDPREIGFQDGVRRILVDEKDTIACAFNDPYKEFMYDGEIHRIRLGAPTRELYVDDKWYECYFGGPPIMVDLGNKKVSIKLEGPPPQVKIGSIKRTDLVIAKINLIINAKNMVPVFLDSKPQIFEIDGQQQTLEFTDALETVVLNGRPFKVEFGGLPKPITIRGKKHFIRFSVLPRGIRAGYVKIAGMKGDSSEENILDNLNVDIKSKNDSQSTATTNTSSLEHDSTSQDASDLSSGMKSEFQLDILSSVLSSTMAPASGLSYQAEPMEKSSSPTPPMPINLLLQKLAAAGMLPIVPQGSSETKNNDHEEIEKAEEKKAPEEPPLTLDKPEDIRIRNFNRATKLYSGMQCSSCGERFSPESASKYSYHLDWHFRQNRRERDPARKAPNRSLFYPLNDWIQYEEMEDVEDRAQSWFEIEKQTAEAESGNIDDTPPESIQPSVPTGSDEDAVCQVCHDSFEQFYNEEKEEWHLRPAVVFENKNYHPLCLQDHKRAMEKSAVDDSMVEDEKVEDTEELEPEPTPEAEIEVEAEAEQSLDETKEETEIDCTEQAQSEAQIETSTLEITEEAMITEETSVEKLIDENLNDKKDETEQEKSNGETAIEAPEYTEVQNIESESQNTEKPDESNDNNILENIFIKKEPEDSVEMDWNGSCDVEIKTEPPEPEPEEEIITETVPAVDTTLTAVKTSIDGNVEHESTPATIPTAPSKIKINITMPIVSKEPEEPKEKPPTIETPVEENIGPLVPASIKPSLKGRKLSNLPPVEKGQELSGLCSIM